MQTSLKQKSRFRSTLLILVLFMFAIMATVASAATIGIDRFNDAQDVCFPTTACTDAVSASSVATASALGGTRDISVTRLSGSNAVSARSGDSNDYFSYSAGNFTQGSFEVVWDGDNDPNTLDHTGLGGFDLTDGGSNTGIYYREVYCDLEFVLRIEIYTDANNWSFGEITIPAAQAGTNFNIDFASFTQGGVGPADFTNVGAIRLMNGNVVTALDFSVDYFAADNAVPTAVTFSNTNTTTPVNTNNAMPLAAVILFGLTGLAIYQFRRQED